MAEPLTAERIERPGAPPAPGMAWIPGGTFRMGSDRHYPEEAPVHRVLVDGFWMDAAPVTNAEFRRFVAATGHVTNAEIAPDPKDYPGALPELLHPGSLVFVQPRGRVDLRSIANWWTFMLGADWRHPWGPQSSNRGSRRPPGRPRRLRRCHGLRRMGGQGPADGGGVGVRRPGRFGRRRVCLGGRADARRPADGQLLARRVPLAEPGDGRLRAHVARGCPTRPTASVWST